MLASKSCPAIFTQPHHFFSFFLVYLSCGPRNDESLDVSHVGVAYLIVFPKRGRSAKGMKSRAVHTGGGSEELCQGYDCWPNPGTSFRVNHPIPNT